MNLGKRTTELFAKSAVKSLQLSVNNARGPILLNVPCAFIS